MIYYSNKICMSCSISFFLSIISGYIKGMNCRVKLLILIFNLYEASIDITVWRGVWIFGKKSYTNVVSATHNFRQVAKPKIECGLTNTQCGV